VRFEKVEGARLEESDVGKWRLKKEGEKTPEDLADIVGKRGKRRPVKVVS